MTTIPEFIRALLRTRSQQTEQLQTLQPLLRELVLRLDRVHDLADAAGIPGEATSVPNELKAAASTISSALSKLKPNILTLQQKLANLLVRFGKGTVNIGVAGKARQGKSTLLQSITGLNDAVIPTGDLLPHTGAKSKIIHTEGDEYAEIDFFTEDEFFKDIVQAYYHDLGWPHAPTNIHEFRTELPRCPDDDERGRILHTKLKDIHSGVGLLADFLSRSALRIGIEDVPAYVSQQQGDKRYMAVKSANISVRFRNQDVTGIAIVDLPGLGQIAKGHAQKLTHALQQEVDAVILVKLPGSRGTDWDMWDQEVVDLIKKALPEIEVRDRLFLLLNEDGQNAKQVDALRNSDCLRELELTLTILCANARDANSVKNHVFAVVLRHLQQQLPRIDAEYLQSLFRQAVGVAEQCEFAIRPATVFFEPETMEWREFDEFENMFARFRTQLCCELDELVSHYRTYLRPRDSAPQPEPKALQNKPSKKQQPAPHPEDSRPELDQKQPPPLDEKIRQAVVKACGEATKPVPVPTTEELRSLYIVEGGWHAVVQDQLHYLRAHLTHRVAEVLDAELRQIVDEALQKIIDGLLAGWTGAQLPHPVQAAETKRAKLNELVRLFNDQLYPTLVSGLTYLLSFSVSYKSHFHFRVREAMNPLDPTALGVKGTANAVEAILKDAPTKEDAEKIRLAMTTAYTTVVQGLQDRLMTELCQDTTYAIFSMVEEARDRLARARESQREWKSFLYPRRRAFWPNEFPDLDESLDVYAPRWRQALDAMSLSIRSLRDAAGEEVSIATGETT